MAKRRWIPIVAGVVILLGFVVIAAIIAVTAWFSQNMQLRSEVTVQDADVEFQAIRQKFGSRAPLLELHDGRPRYTGGNPPAADSTASQAQLTSLHVLVWDGDERELARFTLPFWLLRMKSQPIRLGAYATGMDDEGVDLRPRDIERYGPGIILDTSTKSGERLLLWAE